MSQQLGMNAFLSALYTDEFIHPNLPTASTSRGWHEDLTGTRESASRFTYQLSRVIPAGQELTFFYSIPLRYLFPVFYSDYYPLPLFCDCSTLSIDLQTASEWQRAVYFQNAPTVGDYTVSVISPFIMARFLKPCADYMQSLKARFESPYMRTLTDQTTPLVEMPYLSEHHFLFNTIATATSLSASVGLTSQSLRGLIIVPQYDSNIASVTFDKAFSNNVQLTSFYIMISGQQYPAQPITGAGSTVPFRSVQSQIRVLLQQASSEKYRGQNMNEYQMPIRDDYCGS